MLIRFLYLTVILINLKRIVENQRASSFLVMVGRSQVLRSSTLLEHAK